MIASKQRLIISGRELDDLEIMESVGIVDNSTLFVVFRADGVGEARGGTGERAGMYL